jgi:hypothetical protein
MDIAIQTTASVKLSTSIRALTCGLESAGWTIRCFEMNMATERAKIELVRHDGKCSKMVVAFIAQNGRADIERFIETLKIEPVGRRGDRFIAEYWDTLFVGRKTYVGMRPGLRMLCSYLADNSNRTLATSDVKALLAPLMQ